MCVYIYEYVYIHLSKDCAEILTLALIRDWLQNHSFPVEKNVSEFAA